jgi:hypothetical protein
MIGRPKESKIRSLNEKNNNLPSKDRNCKRFVTGKVKTLLLSQTTGDRTGLATGSSLYKKHVLRNWLVYVILSKTT